MNLILLNYLITVKYPCHPCSIPLRQSVIAFSASSANLNFFQRFGNTKDTKNLKNTKEKRLNQHVHSILWNTERHRKELKTLKWPERKPCPYNTLQGVSFRAPTRNPVPFHLYCHAEFFQNLFILQGSVSRQTGAQDGNDSLAIIAIIAI